MEETSGKYGETRKVQCGADKERGWQSQCKAETGRGQYGARARMERALAEVNMG